MVRVFSRTKPHFHMFEIHSILGLVFLLLVSISLFSPWWKVSINYDAGSELPPVLVYPYGTNAYDKLSKIPLEQVFLADVHTITGSQIWVDPSWLLFFVGGISICLVLGFLNIILRNNRSRILGAGGIILSFLVYSFHLRVLELSSREGISEGYVLSVPGCVIRTLNVKASFELGYHIAIFAIILCFSSVASVCIYEKLRRKQSKL